MKKVLNKYQKHIEIHNTSKSYWILRYYLLIGRGRARGLGLREGGSVNVLKMFNSCINNKN
jgi:hypothetical protein